MSIPISSFALAGALLLAQARGPQGTAIQDLHRQVEAAKTPEAAQATVERFLAEGKDPAAIQEARLILAELLLRQDKLAEAKQALAQLDPKSAAGLTLIQGARMAHGLGDQERAFQLVDAALAKAPGLESRLEIAMTVALTFDAGDRADAIFAKAEKEAKDDQERALVALKRAEVLRAGDSEEPDAYLKHLEKIVKDFGKTEAGATAAARIAAARMTAGSEPIPFEAVALDGSKVTPRMPGKVLLLDFWATWSRPSMENRERILETWRKFHDQGFEVIGIAVDAEPEQVKKVAREKKLPWPQVVDGKGWRGKVFQAYDVNAVPRWILIGKDGKVAAINPRMELVEAVERLLAGKSLAEEPASRR
jgi:tetratricopeptide (TPR) repeat protein